MNPIAVLEGEKTPIPFIGDVITTTVGNDDATGWHTLWVKDENMFGQLSAIRDKRGVIEIRPDNNGKVNGSYTKSTRLSPKRIIRVSTAFGS